MLSESLRKELSNAIYTLDMIAAGGDLVTGDGLSRADMRNIAAQASASLLAEWDAAVRAERDDGKDFAVLKVRVTRNDMELLKFKVHGERSLPIGDHLLYRRPPQASATVPDDVAKDAERYRWMRSNWTTMYSVATNTTLKLTLGDEPWAGFGPDVIDSAIDSAMLAAATHNPETPT